MRVGWLGQKQTQRWPWHCLFYTINNVYHLSNGCILKVYILLKSERNKKWKIKIRLLVPL